MWICLQQISIHLALKHCGLYSEWLHYQCRHLYELRLKSHRATCWSACVITGLLLLKVVPLSVVLFFYITESLAPDDLHFQQGYCFHLYDKGLCSVACSFDQMVSLFPRMWSSSQQTWWLGTQGVTMLESMSAGPTNPKPESLSLLLRSCMCPVRVMRST